MFFNTAALHHLHSHNNFEGVKLLDCVIWPSLLWFYPSWGSGPWNRKVRAAGTQQKICHIYRTIKKQHVIRIRSSLQFFSIDLLTSRAMGLTPARNSPQHFPKFTLAMWNSNPFLLHLPFPLWQKEINCKRYRLRTSLDCCIFAKA